MNAADRALIDYVQAVIRTGSTTIRLPAALLEFASKAAIEDVKALCKINGVTIVSIDV